MRRWLVVVVLCGAALWWWLYPRHADLSNLQPSQPMPQESRPRAPGDIALKASRDEAGRVHLTWSGGTLYRSTADLSHVPLNPAAYPIAKLAQGTGYTDECLGDGMRYSYLAVEGDRASRVVTIDVPPRALGPVHRPELRIDKLHYVLQVLDEGRVVKSYPVSLGRNPLARKLFYDNRTTPEGHYSLTGLQPDSQFYKAYDIDYPNDIDKARYRMARSTGYQKPEGGGAYPGIGGEIEIHRGDVFHNSTNGCIAMRKEDIDELFACTAIAVGTPVTILGSELTAAVDQAAVRNAQQALKAAGFDPGAVDGQLGQATGTALGQFQEQHRLPLTLLPDPDTLAALKTR